MFKIIPRFFIDSVRINFMEYILTVLTTQWRNGVKVKKITFLVSLTLIISIFAGCGQSAAAASGKDEAAQSADTETVSDAYEVSDINDDEAGSEIEEAAEDPSEVISGDAASESTEGTASASWEFDLSLVDMGAWNYESGSDVYWQVGLSYVTDPADEYYETLGIFVPGAYFDAVKNSDGTYSCTINDEAQINGYTASTAPVLFPVNTPGHKAQDAPDSFSKNCTSYTSQGFIYVLAGCRGKDAGIPSGVTDLKAAIRYIRYNEELLPGDTDRYVVFGMSGGGSQCAVLGASGDSSLYFPYLESLGAAATSDAVAAAMCWCPITGFDSADLAYEWNMGVTREGLSDEMQGYSDALAAAYADYVNAAGFTDEEGNILMLEESDEGIYQAGSYYDYVKAVIEESLEYYLADTEFPSDGYSSAEDYIDDLNSDTEWVRYDASTGKVSISSIAEFVLHFKKATKPIAAFDKLDEGGHELFNTGDGALTHFDSILYEIVKGSSYEADMAEDLARTDYLGNDMEYRLNMFSPLYYLLESGEGYDTADSAQYWRIRTGISQSDTALTTEINLYLALNAAGADVDFETVWEQGHTQAERTGSGTENFIEWVNSLWS